VCRPSRMVSRYIHAQRLEPTQARAPRPSWFGAKSMGELRSCCNSATHFFRIFSVFGPLRRRCPELRDQIRATELRGTPRERPQGAAAIAGAAGRDAKAARVSEGPGEGLAAGAGPGRRVLAAAEPSGERDADPAGAPLPLPEVVAGAEAAAGTVAWLALRQRSPRRAWPPHTASRR
jgi:hypothetical protein